MIPKIIHYCWFGGNPLPELALKCINSWKQSMPDYEIKEWNETNFDVNIISYTKEAYLAKKYAFVSDYARYWILYTYGGVYLDTDVEMVKPIYDILEKGAFMGHERDASLIANPGLGMACDAGNLFVGELLSFYGDLHFFNQDGTLNMTSIGQYLSEILKGKAVATDKEIQYVNGFYIYPGEYFGPISSITRRLLITDNTRTIHRYAATWVNQSMILQIKKYIVPYIPAKILILWNKIKHRV